VLSNVNENHVIGAGSMAVGRLVATAGIRSGMVYPPPDYASSRTSVSAGWQFD
jgi:hypothetical protein